MGRFQMGKSWCGILRECDIERIFSQYYYWVLPWSVRDRMGELQPGENIKYIFPGTADTIEICNASDLLDMKEERRWKKRKSLIM